ncbi:CAP domain-containing protein [Laceyella putida]|uniref:CAP domain-containing protein n=1 Tax=Laceyella putida TaxID=110101 RepID=A0ABW2RHT4_9BACL
MKKYRFIAALAITGALIATNPVSTFAADQQGSGTVEKLSPSHCTTIDIRTFRDLDIEALLKQYGFQLNSQSKPAAITAQPQKQPTASKTTKPTSNQAKPSPSRQTSYSLNQFEQQVVDLTNKERAKYGLPALKIDAKLSEMARAKSQDMHDQGYFDHNSPTYGSPFDMMKKYGIQYRTAGENIAMGHRTPQEVVTGWMNSEGHRKNILNKNFTHIGVGYVKDGNYWTQEFIGK